MGCENLALEVFSVQVRMWGQGSWKESWDRHQVSSYLKISLLQTMAPKLQVQSVPSMPRPRRTPGMTFFKADGTKLWLSQQTAGEHLGCPELTHRGAEICVTLIKLTWILF